MAEVASGEGRYAGGFPTATSLREIRESCRVVVGRDGRRLLTVVPSFVAGCLIPVQSVEGDIKDEE